jgi:DNA-binding XRE family transcriptional regulator
MIDENKFTFKEGVSPIKQIRNALGLSQEQFARQIGVSVKTVYRWEKEKEKSALFTLSQVRSLQEAIKPLGLDLGDLPDFLGPPTQQEP